MVWSETWAERSSTEVLAAIDQTVEGFLNEALQISPQQVAVQLKAEAMGLFVTFSGLKLSPKCQL